MAARTGPKPVKKPVGTAAVVIALVALIALVGWLARVNFAGGPKEPPAGSPTEQSIWFAQKAKESGGDVNKLSAEDRQKVESMTMGHGAPALKDSYEKNK